MAMSTKPPTTAVAVDFLERYEGANELTLRQQLAHDLSRLGEHLTTRIELEDQLITSMLDGEPSTDNAA